MVIAAITSCTNTFQSVGDDGRRPGRQEGGREGLANQALGEGKPRTRFESGDRLLPTTPGLDVYLDKLRFNLVGYGCTTCIGNSGPLPAEISKAIHDDDLVVAAVLSGNRNFEGRINSDVRANYLASPPLVVAYALAGTMDIDHQDPSHWATTPQGNPVFLKDIWPTQKEVSDTIKASVRAEMFHKEYGEVFKGDERWNLARRAARRPLCVGRRPRLTSRIPLTSSTCRRNRLRSRKSPGARVLAVLGDSITDRPTSHQPARSRCRARPDVTCSTMAWPWPTSIPTARAEGNHEVMVRGTFANIRLKNTSWHPAPRGGRHPLPPPTVK